MRRLALLFLLAVLTGCIADYSKLEVGSFGPVRFSAVSLSSAHLDVTAEIGNRSGRDLKVCGVVMTSPDVEGISVSMDSVVTIRRGTHRMEIPVVLEYNPISFLSLAGKMKDGIRVEVMVRLPHGKFKIKRKLTGAALASLLESVKK